jgi:hypothetical protein
MIILVHEHITESDQVYIQWVVGVDIQQNVNPETKVGSNRVASLEMNTEEAETLWIEHVMDSAQLAAVCTKDKVGQETAWSQEAMSIVLDCMPKLIWI